MSKEVPRKPIRKTGTYLKFGFVAVEHEYFICPKCGHILNAGPNYQPRYCSECGQRVTFRGVVWKDEKEVREFSGMKRGVLNE